MRLHQEHQGHSRKAHVLENTSRIETFSDAIIAIAMTILILEVHVPQLVDTSTYSVIQGLLTVLPHFLSFALSFVTLAVIWVNHHTFFHELRGTDAALQWYNNHLMFWVCVIPFVTAFLGTHPFVPLVVALYGAVMTMMAIAFTVMVCYVFFKTDLLPEAVSLRARQSEARRAWVGVGLYAFSIPLAFFLPVLSLLLFGFVILFYFLPNPFDTDQDHADA
jgi:uncharacterized membrane protein